MRNSRFCALVLVLVVLLMACPGRVSAAYRHQRYHRRPVRHSQSRNLAAEISAILHYDGAGRAHWGVSVVTLNGTPVYSLHAARLFTPASNAKLTTASALLALLPSGTTWTTRAVTSGTLNSNGVLHGDIDLLGSGDPTMSGRHYPYDGHTERPNPPLAALASMADQIVADGVKVVDGDIVGNDTWFPWQPYAQGWSRDDLMWEYGAPVSALSVNDNVVYLNVDGRGHISWNPDVPYYNIEDYLRVVPWDRRARAGVDRVPGSMVVRLFGRVNRYGLHVALAVQDPADFAARALRQMLLARGVTVVGDARADHRLPVDTEPFRAEVDQPIVLHPLDLHTIAPPIDGQRVLATHVSPPFEQDVTVTLKVSQNLHAGLYLRVLGRLEGGDGSIAQGARVVRQFLVNTGIDPSDFLFFDGCGLSTDDLITPRALTHLLVYDAHQSWGAELRNSLPIGGEDGTLSDRFRRPPLRGRVFAKTGTLSGVNTLSGYLITHNGRTLVFSIMCNGHEADSSARRAMDRVVAAIYADE